MSWIKDIIDLLMLRKQEKKLDLDIEKGKLDVAKGEKEAAEKQSLIKIASFEDIEKYDPRTGELYRTVRARTRDHAAPMSRIPVERARKPTFRAAWAIAIVTAAVVLAWWLFRK